MGKVGRKIKVTGPVDVEMVLERLERWAVLPEAKNLPLKEHTTIQASRSADDSAQKS